MRGLFRGSVTALLLAMLAGGIAQAQTFPAYPIKIIVPYAPGGGTDIVVRLIANDAGATLGQSIVVDNRPGGATVIGTSAVKNAAADGYTLLATDSAFLINPGLLKAKLPYDTLKEFTGVTMMATAPVLLTVNPNVPAEDLKELIALAKAKPGALNYSSGGIGTGPHMAAELLQLAAGINVKHIPYKGTGPALTAVLSGEVDMGFLGISSAGPYIANGQLRAIALTGDERNAGLPDAPTFAENKISIDGSSYWGIYAPSSVPKPVLDKLNDAFVKALQKPETRKRLTELGYVPIGNSPADHTAQLQAMVAQWIKVVDAAKISVD